MPSSSRRVSVKADGVSVKSICTAIRRWAESFSRARSNALVAVTEQGGAQTQIGGHLGQMQTLAVNTVDPHALYLACGIMV